jgi:hypothetical protein
VTGMDVWDTGTRTVAVLFGLWQTRPIMDFELSKAADSEEHDRNSSIRKIVIALECRLSLRGATSRGPCPVGGNIIQGELGSGDSRRERCQNRKIRFCRRRDLAD